MITGGIDLLSRHKAEIVSLLRPAEALPKPHHPFPAGPYRGAGPVSGQPGQHEATFPSVGTAKENPQ